MAKPLTYAFGLGAPPLTELPSKDEVGGKGANLIEMASLGLPVPPGLVIATSECNLHLGGNLTTALRNQQLSQLAALALQHFEANVSPLLGYMPLVSVRSGARVSMPGMMDTILNVGLTAENAAEWKDRLGPACYKDCLVRLGDMYTKTVGQPVPATFYEQLVGAIGAVFRSWNSVRAVEYRRLHGYPGNWGTAVTVQAMVFGNLNTESCSGVLFTRDPATGEDAVTGEFLPKAQGEDVVAGIQTPRPLYKMEQWNAPVLDQILEISGTLEAHYRDAQDIEFTVENGRLWILQTRNAKRTAAAAFKIAHDLATEGVISKAEAVKRVSASQYQALLKPCIADDFTDRPHVTGIAASPGVVTGPAVFDPAKMVEGAVLIRKETSPDDFPAMVKAAAILTSTGGATSHAAVVARGINKPAVVGASLLDVQEDLALVRDENGKLADTILPGTKVTLDGATGRVWVDCKVPVTGGEATTEAVTVIDWAAQTSKVMKAVTIIDPAQLPRAGRYYLSVALLHKPIEFRTLLKALAQRPDLHGVIGFERPAVVVEPEDQTYLSLFAAGGGALPSPASDNFAFVKVLANALLPKKLKKRWLIHLPFGTPEAQVQATTDAAWSHVRSVSTLADLLAADGPVVFAPTFRDRMKGESVQLEDVLAILSKAGRAVSELGALVSEKDFVNEVLGK